MAIRHSVLKDFKRRRLIGELDLPPGGYPLTLTPNLTLTLEAHMLDNEYQNAPIVDLNYIISAFDIHCQAYAS